jgi:hypothetical protein
VRGAHLCCSDALGSCAIASDQQQRNLEDSLPVEEGNANLVTV